MPNPIAPAKPSPGFRRVFAWYTRRLASKRFNAIRFERSSIAGLDAAHHHDGPIVLAMNHASWWDPLIGLLIAERFFPGRPSAAPMAMEQWETFRFMRKLGIFGVDPHHPDSMRLMADHVCRLFDRAPRSLLAITPQGEFADVRTQVRIRPGISSIAAARADAKVLSVSIEYGFWTDQRPEVFVKATEAERPDVPSTAAWHRSITRSMRTNAAALSGMVITRDPARFVEPFGRSGPGVNATYDALARLRGKPSRIPTEPTQPGTPGLDASGGTP